MACPRTVTWPLTDLTVMAPPTASLTFWFAWTAYGLAVAAYGPAPVPLTVILRLAKMSIQPPLTWPPLGVSALISPWFVPLPSMTRDLPAQISTHAVALSDLSGRSEPEQWFFGLFGSA